MIPAFERLKEGNWEYKTSRGYIVRLWVKQKGAGGLEFGFSEPQEEQEGMVQPGILAFGRARRIPGAS